ncbi:MAG: ribonuclease III [Verrucomicrobia bacterium]|nr:ribonuclease III [Verrucomicrobiota bacterium]
MSREALPPLQARLGYVFRDVNLLERAVTHPSWLQEHPDEGESYQRLEFLGDAVLQLVLTEALFQLYPAEREGVLSQRRASLTKGTFLAQLARELGIETALRLGASEESGGGRLRASALEDALEALIGALYLDSDLATARRVVLGLYGDLADRLAQETTDNPKGRLQELIQPMHGNDALRYEVTRTEGADHAREYEVTVYILSRPAGTGRGTSKKLAEEAAARAALATLPKV